MCWGLFFVLPRLLECSDEKAILGRHDRFDPKILVVDLTDDVVFLTVESRQPVARLEQHVFCARESLTKWGHRLVLQDFNTKVIRVFERGWLGERDGLREKPSRLPQSAFDAIEFGLRDQGVGFPSDVFEQSGAGVLLKTNDVDALYNRRAALVNYIEV